MATYYISTMGNDTTGVGSSGNPWATFGKLCTSMTGEDTGNVKADGVYTESSGVTLPSIGLIRGYTTTPGDGGVATIRATAAITLLTHSVGNTSQLLSLQNLDVDGNSTGTIGLSLPAQNQLDLWSCAFRRFTSHGVQSTHYCSAKATGCRFYSNGGRGFHGAASAGTQIFFHGCEFYSNTSDGAACSSGTAGYSFCEFYGNGGMGLVLTPNANQTCPAINCTAYNNTSHGFRLGRGGGGFQYEHPYLPRNCLSYGNGGYGFHCDSTTSPLFSVWLANCAAGSNTSGGTNLGSGQYTGLVVLTGDPFTNAAGGDFSLNNTAGAGAACRAVGFPGVFPAGLTTGYLDIGAVQHQDAGGSTTNLFPVIRRGGTLMKM